MRRWAERLGLATGLLALAAASLFGAENLRINPRLRYDSDSNDGPLLTGTDFDNAEIPAEQPTHIIFYQRECYNSKRQARRTVVLYEKYRGRVHFVVVDLEAARSPAQRKLIERFYRGSIPHVTLLGKGGRVLYNDAGEVGEKRLADILDRALE